MKTKMLAVLTALLLTFVGKAQCPLTFQNLLGCNGSVDISWTFEDCTSTACGTGGSATVPFMGTINIPCDPGCTSGTCNIIITLSAVNGCPITPQSISWLTAASTPGGKAYTVISCAGAACGNCCDSGNSVGIDTNTNFAWVN